MSATIKFQGVPFATYQTRGSVLVANSSGIVTANVGAYDPQDLINAGCQPILGDQAGSSGSYFNGMGSLFRYFSSAGGSPGATAADNVIAVFSLPANLFDGIGNRELSFKAMGSVANNTNSKRIKIIINPATAVVGSTVGTGGTTIADTGAYTTTGAAGFILEADVVKYGVSGSNTQLGFARMSMIGTTVQGMATTIAISVPAAITATESAAILVAVTGNAGTTATDILLNLFDVYVSN